jgi:hypothetical protein
MRVRVSDPELVDDLVGFLQRARCLAEVLPDGNVDVYLPHDLPGRVARAETSSYLRLWARSRPGVRAELIADSETA